MNTKLADQITKYILKLFKSYGNDTYLLFQIFQRRLAILEKEGVNTDSDRLAYFIYWAKDLERNPDVAIAISDFDNGNYARHINESRNITALAEKNGLHVTDYNWKVRTFHVLTLRDAEQITSRWYRKNARKIQSQQNNDINHRRLLQYVSSNDDNERALTYYTLLLNDLKMLEPKFRISFRKQILSVLSDISAHSKSAQDSPNGSPFNRRKYAHDLSKLINSDYFIYLSFVFETFLIATPYWKDLIQTLKSIFDLEYIPGEVRLRNDVLHKVYDESKTVFDWSRVTDKLVDRLLEEKDIDDIPGTVFFLEFSAWIVALNTFNILKDIVANPNFEQEYNLSAKSELQTLRLVWGKRFNTMYGKKSAEAPDVFQPFIANLDAIAYPETIAELLNLKPEDDKKYQLLVLAKGAYREESVSSQKRHFKHGLPNQKTNYKSQFYKLGGLLNTVYQAQFKPITAQRIRSIKKTQTDMEKKPGSTQLEQTILDKSRLALELVKRPDIFRKKTITDVIADFKASRESGYKWLYEFYYQTVTRQIRKKLVDASIEQLDEAKVKALITDFHLKPKLSKTIVERRGDYHRKA